MNKRILYLAIPILLSGLFSLLLTTESFQSSEYSIYDLLLRIKPEVEEDENLLLVNIDDLSITNINMYPIGRDIFADGLMLMKELGAAYAVLDIEFIDKSPAGLNNQYLEEQIPRRFNDVFYDISQQQQAFIQALQGNQIPLEEAGYYQGQLDDYSYDRQLELLNDVNKIARDNDEYLGKAVSFFGNVVSTVNMMKSEDDTTPPELKELAREKVSLNRYFTTPFEGFTEAQEIKPAIYPVLSNSISAGYPRVNIDKDGVRRRIDLIYDYQGDYYPQLGFSALLHHMDVQEIERTPVSLVLKGALTEDNTREDLEIPLDRFGMMMINWPAKKYVDSFRHISFFFLYRHDMLLDDLVYNLRLLNDQGLLEAPFYQGDYPLMDLYGYLEMLKQDHMEGIKDIDLEEYIPLREMFLSETDAYLNGEAEQFILSELDSYLTIPDLPEEQRIRFQQLQEFIPEAFDASRSLISQIIEIRENLKKDLEGSISIVGYSGTSTTDIGVNPFEEEYMNMGLYAAVTNTILSGQFLDESPLWVAMVISLIMSLLTAFIVSRLNHPVWGLISGIGVLLVTEAALILVFVFAGIYTPLLTPGFTILLSFIAIVSVNLILSSKEKGFIRSAFAQYLSDDVIKDLLDDPSKLSLGGEERHMTAMFTDVKGFSSISEKLTPQNLVTLLNDYLTEMSNLIMEEKGTIDKYEGDAIIAFFGAPQPFHDHAVRTCRSAIRMKKAEKILNEKMIAENRTPGPLLTRIGINTGDMVVGNMGTLQKMDYTMMGNAVNLSARLEGVNKQYGTWILISDSTYKETGDLFTVRMLDRVRVVGINEPVRLYELVDEAKLTPENILEGLDLFHKGMELFENRQWAEANEMFKKTRQVIPEDTTSEIYMKRCLKFSQDPPPKDWDGVFNLTQK
ncbi:MAG: adenylate/guanylate cyclase domain-containing protein [Spirochaetales bacterium]|nr:adenylate/guanylate cyclase domain-containing protein [Spirochaetales bacterium]